MRRSLFGAVAATVVLSGTLVTADPGESAQSIEVLNRYLAATQDAKPKTLGMTMDTEIDAKIPRLKKEGKLFALRNISQLGRITYNALRFSGDDTIKKEVIARYLKAEEEAATQTSSVAINQQNYKFKYKGIGYRDNRRVHIFEVRPQKKAVGLFRGELWIDPDSYLAVREAGVLVKNPSVFLKKIEFVRSYTIQDGVALLTHMETVINTRLVGKAELSVNYRAYRKESPAAPAGAADSQ